MPSPRAHGLTKTTAKFALGCDKNALAGIGAWACSIEGVSDFILNEFTVATSSAPPRTHCARSTLSYALARGAASGGPGGGRARWGGTAKGRTKNPATWRKIPPPPRGTCIAPLQPLERSGFPPAIPIALKKISAASPGLRNGGWVPHPAFCYFSPPDFAPIVV